MDISQTATRVLVSAAEPSGDRAAAQVVQALRAREHVEFFGSGGSQMAAAGVELTTNVESFAGMGLTDPLRRVGRWMDVWCAVRAAIRRNPPDVALLVDAPDLNLPLARILKECGVPVIYYVGPQVWAWRGRRLALMRRRVDHTALILPFEEALYKAAGVPASFVGHPLLDSAKGRSRGDVRKALGIGSEEKFVALLPGSRQGEVDLIAPSMLMAARTMTRRGIRALIVLGGGCSIVDGAPFAGPADLSAREVLTAADAALVASGTASLEAALVGVPFAIVYKISRASALLARRLLDVPYVGLPNWVLGRQEVEEILQSELTAQRLLSVGSTLLGSTERVRFERLSHEIKDRMGGPGAPGRVADLIMGAVRDARR